MLTSTRRGFVNFSEPLARARCSMYRLRSARSRRIVTYVGVAFAFLLLVSACAQKMRYEPRLDPDAPTTLFANGTAAQAPVDDTVARGFAQTNTELYTG